LKTAKPPRLDGLLIIGDVNKKIACPQEYQYHKRENNARLFFVDGKKFGHGSVY